jgi:SET domain-containing protein
MDLPKKYRSVKRSLKVKKSLAGLGLFTLEPIEKGGFIIEYVGTILNEAEANEKGGKYLFEVSKNRFIDGTNRKNTARYINHSCRPNCEVDIKQGRVLIFAKRAIKAGEELNYDYEKEYFDEYIKPYGCKCVKCLDKSKKVLQNV